MMRNIKVGIIGGAGYTAGEMIRLLIRHPAVDIAFVHSKSNAGNPLHAVHADLLGETELAFTDQWHYELDVLFLCVGHGEAKVFWSEHNVPSNVKVIDLSQDFRIASDEHDFIYGLPELHKEKIKNAKHVSNPGCFATCLQLGLLPLASAGLLQNEIHIQAITGSTGAGQKPSATSHFSWRNNNVSVYKAFRHQHLHEIRQSLRSLQGDSDLKSNIHFVPVRGNFTRGIFATLYTQVNLEEEEVLLLYKGFYENAPFVHISEKNPHLKQVVNTNKGIVYLEKHDDKLLMISMIDNLIKGASGQAIQNMNLMCGLEEDTGLRLKASYF